MKDPIVDEVRQHRLLHTKKFKGNLSAICEDLRTVQKNSGYKVVRFSPKKAVSKKTVR